jgi:hypothetical protein
MQQLRGRSTPKPSSSRLAGPSDWAVHASLGLSRNARIAASSLEACGLHAPRAMKTNQLTQTSLLSTLALAGFALAGFALAGCGAVDPADLGEGSSHQDVAENRALMGGATAVESAPILRARPDSVGKTTATAPELYQLSSGQLHVSYTTSGLDGQPHFTYEDAQKRLDFKGDEIRTSTCDLGTLVTVSLRVTVDTGSTTFTLIVPNVSLDASDSAPVATQGIMATHDFSVLRNVDKGQRDHYIFTTLSGTARFALF